MSLPLSQNFGEKKSKAITKVTLRATNNLSPLFIQIKKVYSWTIFFDVTIGWIVKYVGHVKTTTVSTEMTITALSDFSLHYET